VPQLIALAAADGQLVEFEAGSYLHSEVEAELRRTLAERLAEGGLTVSQIREILGVSRKYAVPLCEYLDRIGFTRRDGDLRWLAQAVKSTTSTKD
jgi:selenocysteine-specific elongation factor